MFKEGKITAFQGQVYEAILRIPAGRVSSYRLVAQRIGCGSAQAVGQALRVNPLAPRVPCHRVIKSDLTLGGFKGEAGGHAVAEKKRLLESEGVLFSAGQLVDKNRLMKLM